MVTTSWRAMSENGEPIAIKKEPPDDETTQPLMAWLPTQTITEIFEKTTQCGSAPVGFSLRKFLQLDKWGATTRLHSDGETIQWTEAFCDAFDTEYQPEATDDVDQTSINGEPIEIEKEPPDSLELRPLFGWLPLGQLHKKKRHNIY